MPGMEKSQAVSAKDVLRRALGASVDLSHVGETMLTAITCDSRKVTPGTLFVAVDGVKVDGATFAAQAAAAGASIVVTHRPIDNLPCPQVLVADSRDAAGKLAAAFYGLDSRLGRDIPLIGVTGTNGKTTTTYIIQSMLNQLGGRCARLGTVDCDLVGEVLVAEQTTPGPMELCAYIRRAIDHGATAVTMEVSSHALSQGRAAGLTFSSAIFTNLTGDHLDYHKTMDAYLAAKCILFERLGESASAIVNLDDPASRKVLESASHAKRLTFSIDRPEAALHVTPGTMTPRGSDCVLTVHGRTFATHVPFIGRHNIYNMLGAFGAVMSLGVDVEKLVGTLPKLSAVPGRLERVDHDGDIAVFVDYAHTDDGLDNVLRAVRPIAQNRVIVVFGCGGDRDKTKRPRMAKIAEQLADLVVVTSDNPRTEQPEAIIEDILVGFSDEPKAAIYVQIDRAAAIREAIDMAEPHDIIVIAGKGHETYQIVGTTKHDFDDRVQAAAALAERFAK